MQGPLSTGLDFFRTVLDLRAYRQQVLSADIANGNTPGFKAVDLDFQAALSAATHDAKSAEPEAPASASLLLVDDPRQFSGVGGIGGFAGDPQIATAAQNEVKYQTGTQVTIDGNSVDLDLEKREAATNAVQYEAAATFATGRINLLMTAVKGSTAAGSSG
ncbi:MAG: flagellar basal body rod protein FlgB [Stellaceae bacterium]